MLLLLLLALVLEHGCCRPQLAMVHHKLAVDVCLSPPPMCWGIVRYASGDIGGVGDHQRVLVTVLALSCRLGQRRRWRADGCVVAIGRGNGRLSLHGALLTRDHQSSVSVSAAARRMTAVDDDNEPDNEVIYVDDGLAAVVPPSRRLVRAAPVAMVSELLFAADS